VWCDQVGERKLADITPNVIKELLAAYAEGKAMRGNGVDKNGKAKITTTNRTQAAASVNRMKASLSALFKYAVVARLSGQKSAQSQGEQPAQALSG